MAKHIVICPYCNKKFDTNEEPFIQIGRRYAHKSCYENQDAAAKKEEKDKAELYEYLNKLFKGKYNYALVNKNIKEYVEERHYTYSGIRKALIYFYEIKEHTLDKANGNIGIVPYIYQDAYNYYYAIWEANQKNKVKDIQNYKPKTIEVTIPIPQRKLKKKRNSFSFLDEENENE